VNFTLPNKKRKLSVTTISGTHIWLKLKASPEFVSNSEEVHQAAKPYVEMLPDLFAELLDQQAVLASIFSARIKYLEFVLESGMLEAVIQALTPTELGDETREQARQEHYIGIMRAINLGQQILEKVAPRMEGDKSLEDELMQSEVVGLDLEAYELYLAGQLTIGKIFEICPWVILDNA
jgi:hypothetical protein